MAENPIDVTNPSWQSRLVHLSLGRDCFRKRRGCEASPRCPALTSLQAVTTKQTCRFRPTEGGTEWRRFALRRAIRITQTGLVRHRARVAKGHFSFSHNTGGFEDKEGHFLADKSRKACVLDYRRTPLSCRRCANLSSTRNL